MENPIPQLSGKRAIVEQNGMKFGLAGNNGNTHGAPLALRRSKSFCCRSVQLEFSRKYHFQKDIRLLIQIAAKIYQTSSELSSQLSSQNYVLNF